VESETPVDGERAGPGGERGDADDERAIAGIRTSLADAQARLTAGGARHEALAEYVIPRKVLLFGRDPVMSPRGRVWRLGVLMLGTDGTLYATGMITRALEPGRAVNQSVSAEVRREYRAAAFRGPFERGETVNFGATTISLDAASLRSSSGPLVLVDHAPLVRWSASADVASVPLQDYLNDRVDLLDHPPEGA
jgi:hypothetical protein